ncbi:MAG: GNAT family N-acetyltransferase [Arenimonas sp.]
MMTADMQFRPAVPEDAIEIADFMTRNFLAAYGHSASPENTQKAVQDYYGVDAQHADLANDRIVNCLCIVGDKIAGLAQVKPPKADSDPYRFELSRFYVDAQYHGKGIAPVLMQTTMDIIRTRGANSLWLSVWQGSQQAVRFYQKQGFVITGETIFMIGDDPANDWVMTKRL